MGPNHGEIQGEQGGNIPCPSDGNRRAPYAGKGRVIGFDTNHGEDAKKRAKKTPASPGRQRDTGKQPEAQKKKSFTKQTQHRQDTNSSLNTRQEEQERDTLITSCPQPPFSVLLVLTGVEVGVEAVGAPPRGHELDLRRRLRVVVRKEYVEREETSRIGGVVRSGDHHLRRVNPHTETNALKTRACTNTSYAHHVGELPK